MERRAIPKYAVLVTGSRKRDTAEDYKLVHSVLSQYPLNTLVIHGKAPGIDSLADSAAEDLAMGRIQVPYFGFLGRRGGPARNKVMLTILLGLQTQGYTIHCRAFPSEEGAGTQNMMKQVRAAGVKMKVYREGQ